MIQSIAVTFISPTQDTVRAEADQLFDSLFGADSYAVGGVELTPYELSDPVEYFEDVTDPESGDTVKVVRTKRDVLSWQGTFAAHPTS